MGPIDVVVKEVASVRPDPPHGVAVVLRTTATQPVLVHIQPREIRRLHRLLSGILDQFPAQEDEH